MMGYIAIGTFVGVLYILWKKVGAYTKQENSGAITKILLYALTTFTWLTIFALIYATYEINSPKFDNEKKSSKKFSDEINIKITDTVEPEVTNKNSKTSKQEAAKNVIPEQIEHNQINQPMSSPTDTTINALELSKMFKIMSNNTELQRDLMLDRIKNKIIQWNIIVYDITKSGEKYLINGGIEADNPFMAFKVTPQNEKDIQITQKTMTGDILVIRGKFTGKSFMRTLDLDPAVLVN